MNTDQFLEHSKDQGFTWCRIYSDNTGNLVAAYSMENATQEPKDAEKEFIKRIKNFAQAFPGMYSIHCKKLPTSKEETTCKIRVSFGGSEETLQANAPIDIEKIKSEVLQGIRAEEKIKEREREVSELKAQIEKTKTAGSKFVYVLEMLMERVAEKFLNPPTQPAQLAGIPTEPPATDDEQKAMLENAIRLLLQHFDIPTLLAMAEKINAKPFLAAMLKDKLIND